MLNSSINSIDLPGIFVIFNNKVIEDTQCQFDSSNVRNFSFIQYKSLSLSSNFLILLSSHFFISLHYIRRRYSIKSSKRKHIKKYKTNCVIYSIYLLSRHVLFVNFQYTPLFIHSSRLFRYLFSRDTCLPDFICQSSSSLNIAIVAHCSHCTLYNYIVSISFFLWYIWAKTRSFKFMIAWLPSIMKNGSPYLGIILGERSPSAKSKRSAWFFFFFHDRGRLSISTARANASEWDEREKKGREK